MVEAPRLLRNLVEFPSLANSKFCSSKRRQLSGKRRATNGGFRRVVVSGKNHRRRARFFKLSLAIVRSKIQEIAPFKGVDDTSQVFNVKGIRISVNPSKDSVNPFEWEPRRNSASKHHPREGPFLSKCLRAISNLFELPKDLVNVDFQQFIVNPSRYDQSLSALRDQLQICP